jgi:hypothetical protein
MSHSESDCFSQVQRLVRAAAKSHQINGALDWLVGCSNTVQRVQRRLLGGRGNARFIVNAC